MITDLPGKRRIVASTSSSPTGKTWSNRLGVPCASKRGCGYPRRYTHLLMMLLVLAAGFLLPEVSAESATPREIEVMLFEGGEGLDFFIDCARAYEKAVPDVKVNLYGDPRIADKVRIRILEGSHPDITNAHLDYWTLIEAGLVRPVDEYLDAPNWEKDSTWRESFLPGSLDFFTHKGKAYCIPLMYHVRAIWYNKGMFEEHGWQPANTWPEFLELCESIKTEGISPLAFQGRYPSYANMLIIAAYYQLAGADAYEAQSNIQSGSFDNPEFIEALRFVQKTGFNYFQPGAMGMSHTEAQMQFFNGNTAMVLCGSWLKSEMLGKIPEGFRLGSFNFPVPPNGKGDPKALLIGSGYFFIMGNARNPELAADFLRFMTSRKMAEIFCRTRDIPVAVKGVSERALSEDLRDLSMMIKAAKSSYGESKYERDMKQKWIDACFNLLTPGRMTPEQVAAELERGAAEVRSREANPDKITVRHVWKPVVLLTLLASAPIFWLVSVIRRRRKALNPERTGRYDATARMSWKAVLVFLGPAVLIYSLFVVLPCVKSFVWSVYRWDGLTGMAYKGMLNFKRLLFESDAFWIALGNNLFLMFVVPIFLLPLSLFIAACISRRVRGSGISRAVILFPNIMGVVAATLLWMHMFNPQGGVINGALLAVGKSMSSMGLHGLGEWLQGFRNFAWLAPDHLYWAIVPITVWGACGFNVVLLLAAMETIPPSLYEAADIDGATSWRQFWTITMPLIRNVLAIAMVFMVIGGMKAFERIWLLTNQNPATQTHVVGTLMVQSMFTEYRIGEATAIAVLLFLMVFYGSTTALRLMRREKVEF